MSAGAERFTVSRSSLRNALLAVAPFAASSSKDDPDLVRMCVLVFRGHLVVTATDRHSWAAARMPLVASVPGVPAEAPALRAWSIDTASAKAITQVIRPPSDKDARAMWEGMDALLTFDGDRVHVEEVGEFTGGREVAVETTVETGPVQSSAPARAVPVIAAGILQQAGTEVDERRVPGDRLVKLRSAAAAAGDVVRYAHRGDWLVATCGEHFVGGVYAPITPAPAPGSGDYEPGDRLDAWHDDLHRLGTAIKPLEARSDQ